MGVTRGFWNASVFPVVALWTVTQAFTSREFLALAVLHWALFHVCVCMLCMSYSSRILKLAHSMCSHFVF